MIFYSMEDGRIQPIWIEIAANETLASSTVDMYSYYNTSSQWLYYEMTDLY